MAVVVVIGSHGMEAVCPFHDALARSADGNAHYIENDTGIKRYLGLDARESIFAFVCFVACPGQSDYEPNATTTANFKYPWPDRRNTKYIVP